MTRLTIDTAKVFEPLLMSSRYKGAFGGRGCVHPDTLIDTPNGQIKINQFLGGQVFSYKDGKIVIANATKPKSYTEEDLYEVKLSNCSSIIVTDEHKFLTPRGWVKCSDLSICDEIVCAPLLETATILQTNLDIYQQELPLDALSCSQKREDFLGDYSECHHQYDQQLQFLKGIVQVYSQPQAYALQHIGHVSMRSDDLEFENKRNSSQSLFPPSNQSFPRAMAGKCCEDLESYICGKTSEQPLEFCKSIRQFHKINTHCEPSQVLNELHLDFCNQKNLDGIQKMRLDKQVYNAVCDSLFTDSCYHDLPILSKVVSISNHSRQVYWDLHVPFFENYLSNGIVNHNSGKSHFFGELMIEENIRMKLDNVCFRETLKSLEFSVKKLLENKIESLNAGAYFEVQDRRILTARGGVIIFEGMQNHTSDSIKSLEGFDRAWFAEAQRATQKSLDLLRPTIRKPGSELWFDWNPSQETDPIEKLLRCENPPPDSIVVKANYQDNPWLPDVLKNELEYDRKRDYDKYLHIWEGEYQRAGEARIFKNWTIEEFERPPGTIFRIGADWGFSIDPSVIVRCSIDGNRLYVDYESYLIGCEIVNLPDLFDRVPESRKWFITADSSRPETIDYMRKHGFPKINPARKGANSLAEGISFLQSFDIVVHPRCKHLIDELSTYSYKRDPLTDQILSVIEDKNNHVIDALRYACEGIRLAKKPVVSRQIVVPRSTPQSWLGS